MRISFPLVEQRQFVSIDGIWDSNSKENKKTFGAQDVICCLCQKGQDKLCKIRWYYVQQFPSALHGGEKL